MTRIGFIGLGIMGKPMAKNLLKAGHALVVYDIVRAGADEVVAAGAARGSASGSAGSASICCQDWVPKTPAATSPPPFRGIIDGETDGMAVEAVIPAEGSSPLK